MQKPVLTIFYQYNPWNASIGGIQTLIGTFIKYAPEDFEVRLVGTAVDHRQPLLQWQETELAGRSLQFLPLLYIPDDNVRRRVPTTLRYLSALVGQKFCSDFMHFHRLEPTLAALPWPGDKTLFVHNDIRTQMLSKDSPNAILWRRFAPAYFQLERLLIGQFNQIFSCNTDSVALYRQRYPALGQRVTYFTNTVDDAIFFPLDRPTRDAQRLMLARQLGLPEQTRFILFAGRLHPQKDPLLLLQAFARLQDPTLHLLVAGEGELADQMHTQMQQLDITSQVIMLGAMSQSELANLHQLASVCILTSAYEGLPLVALEALACGTPVVTTLAGDTPQLLTSNSGVVCSERTATTIAQALQSVLNHPDHYPAEACVSVVRPYHARSVVQSVFQDMLTRWQPEKAVALL